ncbi:TerC/Alx family metal homeostasis membrane protein [Parasegetibacter sp. NRK P23]|uniref:TerC/Alx family metal homeostasis membrane protein n=1 Tax=Parasegetibacter sp. NRK P23 TaxID=2942999 RepID=UPI002043DB1A|nr:TerC/Alx family metal homeostasis membrane protein [Parasegetibacter sp. NRK P23]MCM5530208.1 TerC/Alx family metal homeostasis membrane protein [Parasegetibacter sp. NRK P23]
MTHEQITYLVFGIVLVVALVLDLGLLSKKNATMSIKKALVQTCFWVGLAFAFGGFVWYEEGKTVALEYISAYLMEWSLSIDNIFVFILIFGYFNIKEKFYPRVLLIGILMAIVFRIIFITVGIELVTRFEWLLYIFGAFLVYTGIKMFGAHNEDEVDIESNKVYKFLKRILPLIPEDGDGKLSVIRDGKRFYTSMFVVIAMLATTDIIFALDSIPAVFAISSNPLVVYTSNIFAVLGLRSLFFLLRGAVDKFTYLQQGIAIVLVFIGIKMLVTFFHIHIHIAISLSVIVVCIAGSIFLSMWKNKREIPS